MELFTINQSDGYIPHKMIDEYNSLIWTERFIDPGDFQLTLPATRESVQMLRPGTMLGVTTSREPMLVSSRSVNKDKVLTAKGKTIEAFFDERPHSAMLLHDQPGVILAKIVTNMQSRRDAANEIPGLRNGEMATRLGGSVFENIKAGKAHTTMLALAKKYNVGMAVYRVERPDGKFDLVFSSRYGEDRASFDDNRIVFSPELDNFVNIEELLSDEGAKTVAIVYPPTNLDIAQGLPPMTTTLDNKDYSGFERRVVEVTMDFITKASQLEGATTTERLASLVDMMRERGQAALRPKKKLIDGEITADARYRYYSERNPEGLPTYRLGDQVVIAGNFTDSMTGILTEYIQSSDPTGSRSYPTVANLNEFIPLVEDPGDPT